MRPWPPHIYKAAAVKHGVSKEVAERALSQVDLVIRSNPLLSPVLTLGHLAELTAVSHRFLRAVVSRRPYVRPYTEFFIRKRSGGERRICVPREPLQKVQRWINRFVLQNVPVHFSSRAYAAKSSHIDCARVHCGAKWLIKLDIKDFFESITEIDVYRVFRHLGYQPLIAFEMARICTHTIEGDEEPSHQVWGSESESGGKVGVVAYRCEQLGVLPQGAPTSPMLSNLVMREFDASVAKIADGLGLLYTRYSDDLAFSSSDPNFSRIHVSELIARVFESMRSVGLKPKLAKTVVAPPGARKIVLGLLVDGQQPRLTREFRKRLEHHLYYLNRVGPRKHCEHVGFDSALAFKDHLMGLLNYAAQVEPAFAEKLWASFESVKWDI